MRRSSEVETAAERRQHGEHDEAGGAEGDPGASTGAAPAAAEAVAQDAGKVRRRTWHSPGGSAKK